MREIRKNRPRSAAPVIPDWILRQMTKRGSKSLMYAFDYAQARLIPEPVEGSTFPAPPQNNINMRSGLPRRAKPASR